MKFWSHLGETARREAPAVWSPGQPGSQAKSGLLEKHLGGWERSGCARRLHFLSLMVFGEKKTWKIERKKGKGASS
jgi:hypothetical protein